MARFDSVFVQFLAITYPLLLEIHKQSHVWRVPFGHVCFHDDFYMDTVVAFDDVFHGLDSLSSLELKLEFHHTAVYMDDEICIHDMNDDSSVIHYSIHDHNGAEVDGDGDVDDTTSSRHNRMILVVSMPSFDEAEPELEKGNN